MSRAEREDEARERIRLQTARNVQAIQHERAGDWDAAVALYEANAAEGFPGDLPYGHLALIYTRRGQPEEVVRVLERAVEVFSAVPRSNPDRALRLKVFRQRLKEARRLLPRRPRARRAATEGTAE